MIERVDLLVVGAGLFGAHAALHFAAEGRRVLLVEREERTARWAKASLVNQARVHGGHHYPRSIRTALMARHHRDRFQDDHADIINGQFKAYYAVERYGSLTDARQFERFCSKVGIKHSLADRTDLFSSLRIQALFEVDEATFDPFLLRQKYDAALNQSTVELSYGTNVVAAGVSGERWLLEMITTDGVVRRVEAGAVINATYAAINSVNVLFGMPTIDATHELSEVVLVHCPSLNGVGLTVIDGPFLSIMPFGRSGLHSLTSVVYTHRAYSAAGMATFYCQEQRSGCTPQAVAVCSRCAAKPPSNARKMITQLSQYLKNKEEIYVHGSLHTVKTKLKTSLVDDGRATDIMIYSRKPFFACVFSGKVNSVYEVEKIDIEN